jgi:V8-like Glu-specific endopeptidase
MNKRTMLWAVISVLGCGACGGLPDPEPSETVQRSSPLETPASDSVVSQQVTHPDRFDAKGHRFVWRSTPSPVPEPASTTPTFCDHACVTDHLAQIAAMSDYDLGEQLRPIMFNGTDEYVRADDVSDLITATRTGTTSKKGSQPYNPRPDRRNASGVNHQAQSRIIPGNQPSGKPAPRATAGAGTDGVTPYGGIIGTDDRYYNAFAYEGWWEETTIALRARDGNPPSFPAGTYGGGCSANVIGPSTALSAAHCFYLSNSGWYTNKEWAAGMSTYKSGSYVSQHYSYGIVDTCYDVYIPSGHTTSDDIYWDYAAIEYSAECGLYPGDTVGWPGLWEASDTQILNTYSSMMGYPGPAPDAYFVFPTLYEQIDGGCDVDSYIVYFNLDDSGGDSGAAIVQEIFDDGTPYITAVNKGDSGGTYNWGRRTDSTVVAFIEANTAY